MMTFQELALKPEIIRAVTEMGFEKPTPVQAKAIPAILQNPIDLITLAQTGTGKTAAFGLPIINEVRVEDKFPQVLILCPTRELCMQIARELENFAKFIDGLRILSVYGGANIQPQVEALRKGVHIVVGTPGRTLDLFKRRSLKVDKIEWLVLDEADEMLTMGFKDDLDEILSTTPSTKRTLLFSATMPKEIERITKTYMNSPDKIEIGKRNAGTENVNHIYYMVAAKNRYAALKRIADMNPKIFSIVFCRTRQETKDIADKLVQDGYNADSLHGDLSQAQRDVVMNKFRKKHLRLLVATDVAARGLDVNSLTHVINYNLPDELEAYVHRSGRTGRAGKKGTSIAIVHSREGRRIKMLENMLKRPFVRAKVPTGEEVCAIQLYNLIDKMEKTQVDEESIAPFMDTVYKQLESMSREDIIKRFVAIEFSRFIDYYKNSVDINVNEDSPREGKKRTSRASNENFARMFINLGDMDRLTPTGLIGLINDTTGKRDIEIGKIDIKNKFSFFDADKDSVDLLMSSFKGKKSENGFDIAIEVSHPEVGGGTGERRSGKFNRSGKSSNRSSDRSKSRSSDRSSDRSKSRSSDKSRRPDRSKQSDTSSRYGKATKRR